MNTTSRMTPIRKSIEILLVEDSPGDILLIQEGFDRARIRNTLHVVTDGVQAMEYLRRQTSSADSATPDLILLDLNLPRMDGRQVLAEVKGDPDLMYIPIVVLTTSDAQSDILRSYGLHANSYVTKPMEFPQFLDVVRAIEAFWLSFVQLPSGATASA